MDQENKSYIHFNRIYVLLAIFIIFFVILEIRLFYIQVCQHEFYTRQSNLQSIKKIKMKARRGEIFDRHGECIATNLIHFDLGIDHNLVKNKSAIIRTFAASFHKSGNYFAQKIKRQRNFSYLARKVPENNMQEIKKIKDPGLVILENSRRYYPFNKYAGQLIGFTNVDDIGASGIEMQFEKYLKGTDGWTILLADAKRRLGYNVDYPYYKPAPGANIILTIDKNFQTIVEEELETAVNKYNANYGIAVLMNPETAEILAMCSSPGFNPNCPNKAPSDNINNRAITKVFEPGSTFKIFTAAALLQEKILKPNDIVYCENGSYNYHGHVIHDNYKKYGWLTFKKVIEYSSNIGMVKLSEKLSVSRFYRYLKNFGFKSYTGIGLSGENDGILSNPEQFSGISKGIISFGQEIGVTAIQITNAYCAVINGGRLMRPYVIDNIVNPNGKIILENKPLKIRNVIDEHVSQILRSFMAGVVKNGTGKKAAVEGFNVGGKTGTAQKYDIEMKRYRKHRNMASFIGFAPLEQPQYVLAIFLDEPKPNYYGGEVAAPVFVNIMKKILHFIPPVEEYRDEAEPIIAEGNIKIPDLTGMPFNAVAEFMELRGIDFDTEGHGNYITKQKKSDGNINFTLGESQVNNYMPNLKGLTIREALKKLNLEKLQVKIIGKGIVKKQSIPPGSLNGNNLNLILTCESS